jgi:hypothetical protein
MVDEVIDYDPVGVINEKLLHLFTSCPDDVQSGYEFLPEDGSYRKPSPYIGWIYDKENKTWYPPTPNPDPENPNYYWDNITLSWELSES